MKLPQKIDGTVDDDEEGQSLAHAMQEDLSVALQEIRSLRKKMQQLEEEHKFLMGDDRRALIDNNATRNEVPAGISSASFDAMALTEESLEDHESHPASVENQLLLELEKLPTSITAPQSLLRGIVEDDSDISFKSEIPGCSHMIGGVKKSDNRLNTVKYNRRVHFSKDYYDHNDHLDNQKDLRDVNENERILQLGQNLAAEERTNRRKILTLESQTSSYRLEIERMKETLSKLEHNDSLMRSSVNSNARRSPFSGLGTGILAGPTVASSIVIHGDGFSNEDSYTIKLDSDTFALMFIAKPCSQNWAIGISAFAFQITLGAMILWNQIGEGRDSSVFNVPFKVDLVVRTGQFLTIILCISTQSDILTSIQAFLLFENGGNWNVSIGEEGNISTQLWVTRVLIPNAAKLIQGLVVILTSYVIIVQSDNIITLLKDFTALMVLSETDNILFGMADYGYLGEHLQIEARKVGMFEFEVKQESTVSPTGDPITTEATASIPFRDILSKPTPRNPFRNQFCVRTTIILFLFIAKICGWLVIVIRQTDGTIFKYKYPGCVNQTTNESYFELAKEHFFDDECFGGPLNSLGCKFEGGDCVNFNLAYPLCKGDDLKDAQQRVGDGVCHKEFATYECDFDGGDCCSHSITRDRKFGDGQCQAGIFATGNCGFDNGDCNAFVRKNPDCELESLSKKVNTFDVILGNAVCESGTYNSKKCGFEAGDCDEGQIGQDLLFSDGYSRGFLSFVVRMSRDGSHVAIARAHAWPSGIVEIFRYNQSMMRWEPAGKILGAATNERFGGSIAMNFDGSRIAIGDAKSREKGSSTGSVQIYEINAIAAQGWTQIGQTIQGMAAFSDTGHTVDLTRDGNRIAISSPSYSNKNVDNSGHIRVFDLHADSHVSSQDNIDTRKLQWIQVGDTIKGQDSSEMIGSDSLQFIGSDGSVIMFSANEVTRFCILSKENKNSTEALHNETDLVIEENMRWSHFSNDIESPNSVAFVSSANGKMIASSSNSLSSTESGTVTIYQLVDNNTWKQVGDLLVAVKSSIADGFGYDLAMSEDGHLLAISSIKRGCNKMIGNYRPCDEFCATGSVVLYSYDYISSRFMQVPPTKFEQRKRDRQESIFGFHISMAGDKSKLSVSGFNFRDTIESKESTGGFVKVYNLDDVFYPKCNVTNLEEIGNNSCQEILPYISKECGFDGGDCNEPKTVDGYPDCIVSYPNYIGSGTCYDIAPYFTAECGWDGGDCNPPEQIENYPDCAVGYSNLLGNTQCDDRPPYNTKECGYDKGDCPIPNDEDEKENV